MRPETTILIVEDESIIADDIRRALTKFGYIVPPPVRSGAEAITRAEELRPHLILMDIKLKGDMDGITAAGLIQERWGVPVAYLTSHSDEATLDRVAATRPYGYILKPFEDRELCTAIEVALKRYDLETKLAERERLLATTIESIADAVIVADEHENVTLLNPVAETVTGWKRAEAIGKSLTDVLRLEDERGAPLDRPARRAVEHGVLPPSRSAVLVSRSGKRIPIEQTTAPIKGAGSHIVVWVVVVRDVSRSAAMALEYEKLYEEAERASHAREEILGIVSHDLKTPLNAIKMSSRLLLDAPQGDSLDRKWLELIDRNARRMERIIDDLLDMASIDAGRLTVKLEHLAVATIVREAIEDQQMAAARKSIRLEATLPNEDLEVACDRGRALQVLGNLISNAIKFTPAGGMISLQVEERDHEALFSVKDTGPGIGANDFPHIFDRYWKAAKTATLGTGLGLFIAKGLVEAQGGRIWATTMPDGATFYFTIPQVTSASPDSQSKAEGSGVEKIRA